MEFSLSDYREQLANGLLNEPNTFSRYFEVNIKKYHELESSIDFDNNLESAFNNIRLRIGNIYFNELFPIQSRVLDFSLNSFPAYRFILPEIITEDWLATVDWHKKFSRDHMIHQPLVAYIIQKLLGNGNSTESFNINSESLLDLAVAQVFNGHGTRYLKDFTRSIMRDNGYYEESILDNSPIAFQIWKSLFFEATYLSGLFHDLGYPWQYVTILSKATTYRGYNPTIPSNDANRTLIDFGNRLVMYPLNGFIKINSLTPTTWSTDLIDIVDNGLRKTHGLPGALGFLYLNDCLRDYPHKIVHPMKQLCVEWAAMGIMMHDLDKLYWKRNDEGQLIPDTVHLRINFQKDPLSFVVTLADFLQEFERPALCINNDDENRIGFQYKVSCKKVELINENENRLLIRYSFDDITELMRKLDFIEEDFFKYFDPNIGYLDMNSIGINEVRWELVMI